jgi:spore maturation protein CgeB
MRFENHQMLAVSPLGGYGGTNTSVHRLNSLLELGFNVTQIDTQPKTLSARQQFSTRVRNKLFRAGLPLTLPDNANSNHQLLVKASERKWDFLWLEKQLTIQPKVLREFRAKQPNCKVIGFSPDDMFQRHNQSLQFLRSSELYDGYITTKSFNVAELQSLGFKNVVFVDNGFDPKTFRPLPISDTDLRQFGSDIGFIGSYEPDRASDMLFLARHGFKIRVFGWDWHKFKAKHPNLVVENRPLYGDNFAKACRAFKINLGFLRKLNRDLQTTRSVEIPACGGFMLAERTPEHSRLFKEGDEAEYFSSRDELLQKCAWYLSDDHVRESIAKAGRIRCEIGEYSNTCRLRYAFKTILFQ